MNEDGGGIGASIGDLLLMAIAFAVAAFFGAVRYVQALMAHENADERFKWVIFAAKAFIAGAAGLLAGWMSQYWHLHKYLAWLLIALAGYGGSEFLQTLKEILYDWLRRKANADLHHQADDENPLPKP